MESGLDSNVYINIEQTTAQVLKTMASNPRRISTIEIKLQMTSGIESKYRAILQAAALNCPVAKSIDPAIEQRVEFDWQ